MEHIHIAIVGCRDFDRPERVKALVRYFPAHLVTLVSGHGGNVDLAAEEEANEFGVNIEVFPADWKKYGKRAGPLRNAQIAEMCDSMIAFWDYESKGTRNAIDWAQKLHKPIIIVGIQNPLADKDLSEIADKAMHYAEVFKSR